MMLLPHMRWLKFPSELQLVAQAGWTTQTDFNIPTFLLRGKTGIIWVTLPFHVVVLRSLDMFSLTGILGFLNVSSDGS